MTDIAIDRRQDSRPDQDNHMTATPMNDQQALYNSRITAVYVEYLTRYHPEIDINRLLRDAEMSRLELEDPAHWFNQNQVDRFNQILVRETGDPQISKTVGRYAVSSLKLGAFKKGMLGFITPTSLYLLLNRYASRMSRGAAVRSRRITASKVEIISTPLPGVAEKPYQCDNRIGTFESLGTQISTRYAKVEHPACIHRGDPLCRYIVSWEPSAVDKWRQIMRSGLVATLLASIGLFFLLPPVIWLNASLGMALLTSIAAAYSQLLENRELRQTILAQGDVAEEHLNEVTSHYNNNLLIQEIGQATATAMDEAELFESVVAVMQNRLDFDRGLLLLADASKKRLRYAAGYGFGDQKNQLLRFVNFRLDNADSKGLFVRCFHEQTPFFVDDIHDLKKQFSMKSQRLIESFGANSLICVPIIFENESLGILAVDTIKSGRKLIQTDLNLLQGVASHLAVRINNARSYQQLRDSEEKYRDIFENVSDFLYTHDMQGRILEGNIAFHKAIGAESPDLEGLMLKEILPARLQTGFDHYLQTVEENGHAEGVTKLRRPDGSELVVEYKNSMVWDGDKPVGVRGSARDITERWEARKEKKRLEGMLERARKMEAVGTLAGGVAHDLNNILSGIVSYPELLLMDLPPDSPLRNPLEIIQDSGQKAAAIVQDLLTMARRGAAINAIVNPGDVITAYLNSPECAKLKAFHPDITIRTETADDLLNVMGSHLHLFKTIMNLVSNAAEAMPDGGTVAITATNRYVDKPIKGYDVVAEGDYVVLTVEDTGTGISEKDQKRIFEPFYTKKVMGRSGTGLGMSVVWATVKDHHGYIDVASQLGRGTTVALYLPVTRNEARPVDPQRSIKDLRGHGESVLVVDDISEQRDIAAEMLNRLGYRVTTVPNGETALEYLKANKVNLVVLDMVMTPGMDGLETYRRILEIQPRQKAIIASGFSESNRVKQAQRLGAGAYVKKPYMLKTIGMAVQAELNA